MLCGNPAFESSVALSLLGGVVVELNGPVPSILDFFLKVAQLSRSSTREYEQNARGTEWDSLSRAGPTA